MFSNDLTKATVRLLLSEAALLIAAAIFSRITVVDAYDHVRHCERSIGSLTTTGLYCLAALFAMTAVCAAARSYGRSVDHYERTRRIRR